MPGLKIPLSDIPLQDSGLIEGYPSFRAGAENKNKRVSLSLEDPAHPYITQTAS